MAYGVVVGFYVASVVLAFGIEARPGRVSSTNPWLELRAGFAYMRANSTIVSIMMLAFLANLTAFPISHGLLPVVARDVYGLDENGLARLVALLALGAVIGAVITATLFRNVRLGRVVVVMILTWHVLIFALGQTTNVWLGGCLVFFVGAAQTLAMVSMSVLLLGIAEPAFRGRVSGVRMLAVYGLPMGLIGGGALIERFDVATTFSVFALVGIVGTLLIAGYWPHLWRASAYKD